MDLQDRCILAKLDAPDVDASWNQGEARSSSQAQRSCSEAGTWIILCARPNRKREHDSRVPKQSGCRSGPGANLQIQKKQFRMSTGCVTFLRVFSLGQTPRCLLFGPAAFCVSQEFTVLRRRLQLREPRFAAEVLGSLAWASRVKRMVDLSSNSDLLP